MTSSYSALKRPQKPAATTQEAINVNDDRKNVQPQQQPLEPRPRAPQTELQQSPHEASGQQQPPQLAKPARPAKPKPLQELDSFTNTAGVEFKTGDRILVSAPWGGYAAAEIVTLYQDDSGDAWAKYVPKESKADWSWLSGCVRALRLIKA